MGKIDHNVGRLPRILGLTNAGSWFLIFGVLVWEPLNRSPLAPLGGFVTVEVLLCKVSRAKMQID